MLAAGLGIGSGAPEIVTGGRDGCYTCILQPLTLVQDQSKSGTLVRRTTLLPISPPRLAARLETAGLWHSVLMSTCCVVLMWRKRQFLYE